MEQSGIEVGVRAIRKWWESACRENRPFVILCENANEHREEAKRNRGGRVHALIAKHESQGTLILIYVSQTSTEMEQSGIEVGVRAMKKKRGARCCLQQTDSSFQPSIDFKDFPLYTHVVSLPGTIVTI